MVRTVIYCYYDQDGDVSDDSIFLLNELQKIAIHIFIIVNGAVKSLSKFEAFSNKVIVRKNLGWDAGAYKEALFDPHIQQVIQSSDELVLCNSSFFGPFIPFVQIFNAMKASTADFWGISSSDQGLVEHIQSYFLVYRKKVIKGNIIYSYFQNYIDKNTPNYCEVCASFENGLFNELVSNGYSYDAYIRGITCNPYKNPYGSLSLDRLPILKKKVFNDLFFDKYQAFATMEYIRKHYSYNTGMIRRYAKRIYNKLLSSNIGMPIAPAMRDIFTPQDKISRIDVKVFIEKYAPVYIYGTGGNGEAIYNLFFYHKNNPNLKGFIVTKYTASGGNIFHGYHVKEFSKEEFFNESIIIALTRKHTEEVINTLKGVKNTLSLWKSFNC